MFAEMLENSEAGDGSSERRRYLGTIRRECDRLQRLIESILDFASLEQGARKLQLEYEEIGALVAAIAEDFRDQAEQDGFQYDVEIEPGLPEVCVDADALRQVLLNLLTNAMKYSDDRRSISVRTFSTPTEVGIAVRDHGIGIAAEEQRHIFEDFYRVDTSVTAARSGLGLGLTLVRGLIQAHGGRISLESELQQGACFTVWLPRSGDAAPHSGNTPERLAAEA
jgi:signal transduction histidine kinase